MTADDHFTHFRMVTCGPAQPQRATASRNQPRARSQPQPATASYKWNSMFAYVQCYRVHARMYRAIVFMLEPDRTLSVFICIQRTRSDPVRDRSY